MVHEPRLAYLRRNTWFTGDTWSCLLHRTHWSWLSGGFDILYYKVCISYAHQTRTVSYFLKELTVRQECQCDRMVTVDIKGGTASDAP